MANSYATCGIPKGAALRIVIETKVYELGKRRLATNANECVLKAAVCDLRVPKRSLPHFRFTTGGLSHENVAWEEPEHFEFVWREVHLFDVGEVQTCPRDVCGAEIWT